MFLFLFLFLCLSLFHVFVFVFIFIKLILKQGILHAKTGTLEGVNCLTGFIDHQDSEHPVIVSKTKKQEGAKRGRRERERGRGLKRESIDEIRI